MTNFRIKRAVRQYFSHMPTPDYGKSLMHHTTEEVQKQIRHLRERVWLAYASPVLVGSFAVVAGTATILATGRNASDTPSAVSEAPASRVTVPPVHNGEDLAVYISDVLRPQGAVHDMLHLKILREYTLSAEERQWIYDRDTVYVFEAEIVHTFCSVDPQTDLSSSAEGTRIDCVVIGESSAATLRETTECFAFVDAHFNAPNGWAQDAQPQPLYRLAVESASFFPVSDGNLSLNDMPWVSWRDIMKDPYLTEGGSLFLTNGEPVESVCEKLLWLYTTYYPTEDRSQRKTTCLFL